MRTKRRRCGMAAISSKSPYQCVAQGRYVRRRFSQWQGNGSRSGRATVLAVAGQRFSQWQGNGLPTVR